MYTGLGCPECAAVYEETLPIMAACYSSEDQVTCDEGGINGAASLPGSDGRIGLPTGAGMMGGFRFDGEELTEDGFQRVKMVKGVQTSGARAGMHVWSASAALAVVLALAALAVC
jgi:hypothetical protein